MLQAILCDNQRLFSESFAVALRGQGARVAIAAHPDEAIRTLEQMHVDRVLMNVRFPSGRGLSAARDIATRWPNTDVICLDADTPELRSAVADVGARGMLSKSRPLLELVETFLAPSGQGFRMADAPPQSRSHGPTAETCADSKEPLAARFLTTRERDVLRLLAGGCSTLRIAEDLGISVATTRGYVQSMLVKLGVHSRVEAVAYAVHQSVFLAV